MPSKGGCVQSLQKEGHYERVCTVCLEQTGLMDTDDDIAFPGSMSAETEGNTWITGQLQHSV